MSESSQPVEIAPGLWIAGLAGLASLQTVLATITHIVSVVNGPPPNNLQTIHRRTIHIDIQDAEEANLLQHLPEVTNFITQALTSGGTVLVHCAQGLSRSVAVCIAYLVRCTPGVTDPDSVLDSIRRRRSSAAPNPGFMRQLHLWHRMKCTLDPSYVPYKRFLAEQAAIQFHASGAVDIASLSQPCLSQDSTAATTYRCRKCRTLVATSNNVIETADGPGAAGFAWRKRDKVPRSHAGEYALGETESAGGGVFVEPLRWMASAIGGTEGIQGKLYCPKCEARLGSFNWAGMQNSGGAWVTPGFQLHVAKLDIENNNSLHQPSSSTASLTAQGALHLPRRLPVRGSANARSSSGQWPGPLPRTHQPGPPEFYYFTHLILDCDGVMVDSERASCEALRLSVLEITGFDIPHNFPHDFRPVFGMDVRSCVEYYRDRFAKTEWGDIDALAKRIADAKEGIYRDLTSNGVSAFPGVRELVEAARAMGMGVAVASSGSPEKIAHNLGSSGLGDLLREDLIVSAKHVNKGKPAPDVYVEALRRLGCFEPHRAVVVEDAVNGLMAAKGAGCFTVAVATSLPAEVLHEHADAVFDSIADVDLRGLSNYKI